MSTTTPIQSSPTAKSATPLGQSQLNMQDFLKLMTTQLENQDPLNPMSDAEYFAQMAQLGTVQGMDTLNNSSQVQQAQMLMGKTVTASNPNAANGGGATVTGVVQSLSIQNGAYYLGIQGANGQITSVAMSAIQSVSNPTDLSGASSLVGKTVTGTTTVNGQQQSVTGDVTGVSIVNGSPAVTIQVSKSKTVTVPVSSLTSIGD